MPLTSKGRKILLHMQQEYGAKKGTSVFYAARNKGRIAGVDRPHGSTKPKPHRRGVI